MQRSREKHNVYIGPIFECERHPLISKESDVYMMYWGPTFGFGWNQFPIIDRYPSKLVIGRKAALIFAEKKENTTMKVSYNSFTGELVKLELTTKSYGLWQNGMPAEQLAQHLYDLSIYDSEKLVTHSFTGVKLEDMKFSGGEVTFGRKDH